MDFEVGFQQEFSFPLGHAGFCLILTKKRDAQIPPCCKRYFSIYLILQSYSHILIANVFLQGLKCSRDES